MPAKQTTKPTVPPDTDDAGAEQVEEKVEAEIAAGFVGDKVDPTLDENYTIAGVTQGKPTPETVRGANDRIVQHTVPGREQ